MAPDSGLNMVAGAWFLSHLLKTIIMSKLQVSKKFSVSVDELYAAWTEKDQLKNWWQPMNKQLKQVDNELKEGGNINYKFEDGLLVEGKYETVKPSELLVYSWNWNFSEIPSDTTRYKLHVHFKKESDNASSIAIEQEGFEDEEHANPHKKGWEDGLGQLAQYLQTNKSNKETTNQQDSGKPNITGYNETPEQEKVGGG